MAEIKLVDINNENLSPVLRLKIPDSEKDFVAPNSVSISEAYVEDELWPRAIVANEEVVGFIMFGRWQGETNYWITRLMVDSDHRGKGFAKAAINHAVKELASKSDCNKICISFEPENVAARTLYTQLGFSDTGEQIEGEVLFELRNFAN